MNPGDINVYPQAVSYALEYLIKNDSSKLDIGKYEVEGKDFYIIVSNSMLDMIENKKPESHKEYLDIQLSPAGGEIMGFAIDTGRNSVSQDLLEEKDVLYYENVENEKFIKMNPNDFFVFYPWDIHRPGCIDEIPTYTKKVVVKLNIKYMLD